MGQNSKIEWTNNTFNPWVGCVKVSPGCKYCYAEELMTRKGRWANTWGPAATTERLRTSDDNWKKPLSWDKQAQKEGRRIKVFCSSLADVFERNDQLLNWRWDLIDLMTDTPNLDWQVLTKRPENVLDMTPWQWHKSEWKDKPGFTGWPQNIWIGTSVENQEQADKRIPYLLQIPAAVRFLSCEPLLGPVDLDGYIGSELQLSDYDFDIGDGVDWVIVGGESGPKARPMHPEWARGLRDQCQAAGVPFHFKQWGEYSPVFNDVAFELINSKGQKPGLYEGDWRDYQSMYKVGKKAAGRLLDGRTWDEMPTASEARQ